MMRSLSVIEKGISNRAMSPTLTPILLGFLVVASHLLLAKLLWGFAWAGFVVGLSLVMFLASGIGYFYRWYQRPAKAMCDSEIVEILDKPSLGRTCLDQSPGLASDGNGSVACHGCRPYPRPQPAIRIPSPLAQKRCNQAQKNSRSQLPNRRF
ncbi:MAG TPA: hypothetical protein VH280_23395 [Verrucomicrobiae bacterium]|jgi:hypothetical protein|nr:hypothetical protein [Verrucomicrobiae bacterium]